MCQVLVKLLVNLVSADMLHLRQVATARSESRFSIRVRVSSCGVCAVTDCEPRPLACAENLIQMVNQFLVSVVDYVMCRHPKSSLFPFGQVLNHAPGIG